MIWPVKFFCLLVHPLIGQLCKFKKPTQLRWSVSPLQVNLDFMAVWSSVIKPLKRVTVVSTSSAPKTCTPWNTPAFCNSANLGPGLKAKG